MPIAPATQAAPSSSIAIAVTARVRVSLGSPTVSQSPAATSNRRRPGAPPAHRYGGLIASAVIGPVSARSLTVNPPPDGETGAAPLPAWQPTTATSTASSGRVRVSGSGIVASTIDGMKRRAKSGCARLKATRFSVDRGDGGAMPRSGRHVSVFIGGGRVVALFGAAALLAIAGCGGSASTGGKGGGAAAGRGGGGGAGGRGGATGAAGAGGVSAGGRGGTTSGVGGTNAGA